MHYDIQTLSLWIGVGVALIVGGIQAAGWRHKTLIAGLIITGGLCIVAALATPVLATILPSLTQAMSSAAANPASWFTLLIFVAALILFSPADKRKSGIFLPLAENGMPHISTPELGRDLRSEIQALEKRLLKRIGDGDAALSDVMGHNLDKTIQLAEGAQKVSAQIASDLGKQFEAIEIIKHQIAIDLPNASTIAEAFRNLDDAVAAKMGKISEEIRPLSENINWLKREGERLLFFAVDLATLAVIEGQIEDGSRLSISLDNPDISLAEQNKAVGRINDYIQSVRSVYHDTHRGLSVNSVLGNATSEAEDALRSIPLDQRPTHLDVLDYRRLKIAETCRVRLLAFLKMQRSEKKADICRQRPDLLDRLTAHSNG